MAMNSDRYIEESVGTETLGFFPTGTDFRLRTSNPLPGLVLEVGDETLAHWVQSAEINKTRLEGYSDYRREGVAADLGRSAIRYLMRASASRTQVDRLTVEALALGIASRGMAQLACLDDDIDSEINGWTRQARRREIDRAIDLIEARLTDNALSITDLADVACLSSSRFSSVFRSMIGETPYNFILRRRAEYARDLIIGTHEPLAQIAYASGFSSQAHMTVVVRRVFGTTPAALRDG
ncbi:MAG: AraC family transcriptional regulator [Pseudomonadota bacterium]